MIAVGPRVGVINKLVVKGCQESYSQDRLQFTSDRSLAKEYSSPEEFLPTLRELLLLPTDSTKGDQVE